MTKLESAIELLKDAYDKLDDENTQPVRTAVFRLCIYCNSQTYSGDRIVHFDNCILKRIRSFLSAIERDKACLDEK